MIICDNYKNGNCLKNQCQFANLTNDSKCCYECSSYEFDCDGSCEIDNGWDPEPVVKIIDCSKCGTKIELRKDNFNGELRGWGYYCICGNTGFAKQYVDDEGGE